MKARTLSPIALNRTRNWSRVHLDLPADLPFVEWVKIGKTLGGAEKAISWWIGDWWAFGKHHYGERAEIVRSPDWLGPSWEVCKNYAIVARTFERSCRHDLLSFAHHWEVVTEPRNIADRLLRWAEQNGTSVMQLRAEVRKLRANQRIGQLIEQPLPIGDPVHVLYADPPWQYENPPMGGGNRSIENHYPTMTLDEICALDVAGCATADAVLFLWATAPKCAECFQVIEAWGFTYRTQLVWDKIDIGMGYHARNQHELLLIAKRGEIPPPAPEDRPLSIIRERRTKHSAKPARFAEIIERMYPTLRKREFFARTARRPGWEEPYGNQLTVSVAYAEDSHFPRVS